MAEIPGIYAVRFQSTVARNKEKENGTVGGCKEGVLSEGCHLLRLASFLVSFQHPGWLVPPSASSLSFSLALALSLPTSSLLSSLSLVQSIMSAADVPDDCAT